MVSMSAQLKRVQLKRGTWSPEEDQKLTAYIKRYGIWNWSEMPKAAGLLRSGKSCRLRWMNYLRPDIKRGNFTKDEEETIIKLHAVLGNRWSMIAAKLPQRTDNEIKNFWNSHLKKRLRDNPTTSRTQTNNPPNVDFSLPNEFTVPITTDKGQSKLDGCGGQREAPQGSFHDISPLRSNDGIEHERDIGLEEKAGLHEKFEQLYGLRKEQFSDSKHGGESSIAIERKGRAGPFGTFHELQCLREGYFSSSTRDNKYSVTVHREQVSGRCEQFGGLHCFQEETFSSNNIGGECNTAIDSEQKTSIHSLGRQPFSSFSNGGEHMATEREEKTCPFEKWAQLNSLEGQSFSSSYYGVHTERTTEGEEKAGTSETFGELHSSYEQPYSVEELCTVLDDGDEAALAASGFVESSSQLWVQGYPFLPSDAGNNYGMVCPR